MVRVCVWLCFPESPSMFSRSAFCVVHSRLFRCPIFRSGRLLGGMSCDMAVSSLARDPLRNRSFGEHCAMPRLTVEASWFEIFSAAVWGLLVFMGLHGVLVRFGECSGGRC